MAVGLVGDKRQTATTCVEDRETLEVIHSIFQRKVKFLELKKMKGETPLDWSLRINADGKLADIQDMKPQADEILTRAK